MKRFITIYLLVTIAGGVFITSGMFYDMYNEPKFCLSIIALLLLFILCCFGNGCIHKLQEGLSSRLFTLGVSCLCLVLSVHAILQYTYVIPSHSFFRITGTFDNPSGYSLVQSILLPFSLQLFIDKCENSFVKTLAVTTVFGALLTILLSGSRCGIMACCTSSSIILAQFKTSVATDLSIQPNISCTTRERRRKICTFVPWKRKQQASTPTLSQVSFCRMA